MAGIQLQLPGIQDTMMPITPMTVWDYGQNRHVLNPGYNRGLTISEPLSILPKRHLRIVERPKTSRLPSRVFLRRPA